MVFTVSSPFYTGNKIVVNTFWIIHTVASCNSILVLLEISDQVNMPWGFWGPLLVKKGNIYENGFHYMYSSVFTLFYGQNEFISTIVVFFPTLISPYFICEHSSYCPDNTCFLSFSYSDLVLYGRPHIPNRILHQWSRGTTIQITQQHSGGLLLCTVRALHLLHNSGAPVCGKSLSSWLRGRSQLGQLGCSMWNRKKRHSSRRGDDRGWYYMVNTKLIKLQN